MSKYRPPGLRKKLESASESGKSSSNSHTCPSTSASHAAHPTSTHCPRSTQASAPSPNSQLQTRLARFQSSPAQPYGLASRGDSRLQNSPAAQHEFFSRISAAAAAGAETDSVLADLRKLREAILHAGPSPFLKQVFLFSVRFAAPAGRYQTYVPCITYLLREERCVLSAEERAELVLLLALQLAHGAGDSGAALAVFFTHLDARAAPRVHAALHAWVRDDHWQWLQIYNLEQDPAMRAVMSGGVAHILRQIAQTLTAAYFQIDRIELERKFLPRGTSVAQFAAAYAPHWEVGDTVVMRRR